MNHFNKMRLAVLFCSLSVLIILSACGSDGTDSEEESVTLTISAAASLTDALEEAADVFHESHPEIKADFNLAAQALCSSKFHKEPLQTCSFLHQKVILIC